MSSACVRARARHRCVAPRTTTRRALVNGAAGMVVCLQGRPFSIASITVRNGRIAEVDFLADPERIAQIDLTVLGD